MCEIANPNTKNEGKTATDGERKREQHNDRVYGQGENERNSEKAESRESKKARWCRVNSEARKKRPRLYAYPKYTLSI